MDPWTDRVVEHWREKKLSPQTVKMLFVILRDFCQFAWKQDLDVKRLNFKHFNDVVEAPAKIKVWTKTEVILALRHCDQEFQDILTVALGTGMRRGELFALTWEDVDILKGEINVNKSVDIDSGEVGPTKTKQARVIQMSNAVAKVLEKSYTPGCEKDRCFRTFNPAQKMKALCKKADIREISFHDLRHTFATTCLEKGLSPKWVSATLGHSKLSTTFDIYWQHFKEKVNLEDLYEP
jgi:integrase